MRDNPIDMGGGCLFVLFGASGDLARRKLGPALYHLFLTDHLPRRFRLIGYSRSEMSDNQFRDRLRQGIAKHSSPEDAANPRLDEFLSLIHYVSGKNGIGDLAKAIDDMAEGMPILYYLALAPAVTEKTLEHFIAGSLPRDNARIMLEKPFGLDLDMAKRLNAKLAQCFAEDDIYRIDHYLAKDTVRNLLVFRFANAIFEPLWNRHYVDHIQVSATEDIGVEERGAFYEEVGVVRDMIQNHVLMLLALATMEPPLAGDGESIRDRVSDLLRSIPAPGPGDFVFGQYDGYRQAKNVSPGSTTPTFAGVRLAIENWRWHGVPIYLISGKCLRTRVSEVSFVFKHIPLCLLDAESCNSTPPNMLTLRIHPDEGIRMALGVKAPGYQDLVVPAALDFRYSDLEYDIPIAEIESFNQEGHHLFTGYERVLLEALAGRSVLFWRSDSIEAAWRVVEPMLKPGGRPPADRLMAYKPGSHGVELAADLFARDKQRWYSSQITLRDS